MSTRSMSRKIALVAAGAGAALSMGLAVAGPASAVTTSHATVVSAQAAPTSVTPPAGTARTYLGVAFGISGPMVGVNARAGRYVVEYDTSALPGAFNTIIDGRRLQQVGVAGSSTGYTETFQLTAGRHTVTLGGPAIYSPAQAYLVGPF